MLKTVVLIILLSLFLLGCRQEEELVTVTAVSPQPTATIVPTVTSAPTIVATETAVSTATNTAVPTITPTEYAPTPTRPTSLPTVSIQNDVNYKLAKPPVENLLNAIRRVAEFESMQSTEERGIWPSYWQVKNLVRADMDTFYPASLPGAEAYINDDTLISYYAGWLLGTSSAHERILDDGLVQYLNRVKPELKTAQGIEEDGFTVMPFSVKLNDDSLSQWILELDSQNFRVRKYLLIGQDADGNYKVLPSNLPTIGGRPYYDGFNEFILDKDFTGDGQNEIVLDTTNFWSNAIEKFVKVYTWDGEKLVVLEPVIEGFDNMEVVYLDGTNLPEIQITNHYSGRFGCEWDNIDVYRWPNQEAQHGLSESGRPNTAVCNLSLARNPFVTTKPDKVEQYQLLEQVVSQFLEDDLASPDFVAYAQSQLAMAYAEQQNFEEARSIIDSIYQMPKQSNYANYVNQNDLTGSLIDLCRNLVANGEQALDSDIGQYINMYATHGVGNNSNDPSTLLICDLAYLVRAQIQNSVMSSSQTPKDLLAAKDIQFEFDHAINLDEDPELEWVGILEPTAPWLVIFDDANGEWQTHFIRSQYYLPIQNVTFAQKDLTQNGMLDLIVSIQAKNDSDYPTSTAFSVYLIENSENGFDEVASQTEFEKPILEGIDKEFFRLYFDANQDDTSLSWKQLDELNVEHDSIISYVNQLQTAVLTQTDPNIHTLITDLLNYLPSDDPEAQPYREHLTYLLGYHYELSGEGEEAVNTYLDLIEQNPSSPWSWLAWARLEPN